MYGEQMNVYGEMTTIEFMARLARVGSLRNSARTISRHPSLHVRRPATFGFSSRRMA